MRRSRLESHVMAAILALLPAPYVIIDIIYLAGSGDGSWVSLLVLATIVALALSSLCLLIYLPVYWRLRHDREKLANKISHWVALAATLLLLGFNFVAKGFRLVASDESVVVVLLPVLLIYLAVYWEA